MQDTTPQVLDAIAQKLKAKWRCALVTTFGQAAADHCMSALVLYARKITISEKKLALWSVVLQKDCNSLKCWEYACSSCELSKMQWLTEHFDISSDDARGANWALGQACWLGQLATAQWLTERFSLTADDARARNALQWACYKKHFTIAQWLVERFNLNATDACAGENSALKEACAAGLETAQWFIKLFSLTAQHVRAYNNCLLQDVCETGDLDVAQWLVKHFSLTARDARALNNRALELACHWGRLEMVKWLVEHFELTAFDVCHCAGFIYWDRCNPATGWLLDRFNLVSNYYPY